MRSTPLKPCPFCGGEAEYHFATWSSRHRIGCHSCGIYTPPYAKKSAAVKRWNRRAK